MKLPIRFVVTAFVLFLIFSAWAKKPLPDITRAEPGTSYCTPTHAGLYLAAGAGVTFTTNGSTLFIEQSIRAASVDISGQTTVQVVFDSPLPDADYVLAISPSKPAGLSWENKTANGFTLKLSSGINGQVDYIATPIP